MNDEMNTRAIRAIKNEIIDMIPPTHYKRFNQLWELVVPNSKQLSSEQEEVKKEIANERDKFWLCVEDKVCSQMGINSVELYNKTRVREVTQSRQILWWIIYNTSRVSLQALGKRYYKDHATCLHGIRQVNGIMQFNKEFRTEVEYICDAIANAGFLQAKEFYNTFIKEIERQKQMKQKVKL
jgi:hypothetical protein